MNDSIPIIFKQDSIPPIEEIVTPEQIAPGITPDRIGGKKPKCFFGMFKSFTGASIMGFAPEPEDVHKLLTSNLSFARVCGLVPKGADAKIRIRVLIHGNLPIKGPEPLLKHIIATFGAIRPQSWACRYKAYRLMRLRYRMRPLMMERPFIPMLHVFLKICRKLHLGSTHFFMTEQLIAKGSKTSSIKTST